MSVVFVLFIGTAFVFFFFRVEVSPFRRYFGYRSESYLVSIDRLWDDLDCGRRFSNKRGLTFRAFPFVF